MTTRIRLCLRLPAAKHRAAARAFDDRLRPALGRHGLVDPSPPGRRQRPDVFARVLRAVHGRDGWRGLAEDPAWRRAVDTLAAEFGVPAAGFCGLAPYEAAAGAGRAVDSGAGYRHGEWHCFGVEDGLPSSIVTGLARGADGSLWLTTHEGGICRFDGGTFIAYTTADGLPDDDVRGLLPTPEGDLWGVTPEGLVRFDGTTFHTYTHEDGVPEAPHRSLLRTADGTVWCAGPGVARFDGSYFSALPGDPPGAPVRHLAEAADGSLWMGTASGGLWRWDGAAFTCRATPGALPPGAVTWMARDGRGRLWVNTEGGGACIDGDRVRSVADASGLAAPGPAWFVAQDPDGRLWFRGEGTVVAIDGAGVERCRFAEALPAAPALVDGRGWLWLPDAVGLVRVGVDGVRRYTTRDGLGHNRVHALHDDADGKVWIASWGGGLNRFDGDQLTTFTTADGLSSDEVEDICRDGRGGLWFATRTGGACHWDGQGFTSLTRADGLGADFLWCLLLDRAGHLWLGTHGGGASRWDGTTLTTWTTADGLPHDTVWDILQDRRGRHWFATQGGGVACRDGERITTYGLADGLPHLDVWNIAEDHDGHLWFGTFAGVCRFDGTRFQTFTRSHGLPHDNVWCCHCAADGRVWLGTWGGGAAVWDPKAARFAAYTVADGLADNNVRSISEDGAGHLWFSTYGGGVSRFDGQVFQTLSRKDGLVHDAVQEVCFDGDGAAWIATEAGVTRYRPASGSPRVRLRAVIADRTHEAPADAVSIPSSQSFVIVEFGGSSLSTPPERLGYVYRLHGVDDDWRTTRGHRVEYHDLPVGSHRFEVCAVDRDLRRSPVAAVDLTVYADTRQDRLEALQAQLSAPQGLEQFIGASPSLQRVLDQIHTVAGTDVTVLILGETGTGKGLAARAVHAISGHADGPYLQVNCGAIPEGLVESELFGHEKGAFTGAVARKIGRFELADGGTLFLDEIGDLPLDSQRALLHVLQDGTFQRVGGGDTVRVGVRVIAATNRDLRLAMRQGTFREDLYYRLSAFVMHLPPLRDRRQDIPLLVDHFLERFARHLHRPTPGVDPASLDYLCAYGWPGNVRELEHVVQRGILVCRGDVLRLEDLFLQDAGDAGAASTPRVGAMTLDEHRQHVDAEHRRFIVAALEATGWVVYGERGAAHLLGTHPEKLRVRMRALGIVRPDGPILPV